MAIITQVGLADIKTASFEHTTVNWNKFVIGDANGISYVPTKDRTELVHQVYEGDVSSFRATDPVTGYFDIVLPADVGGFMVREVGILNDHGDLVAVDCFAQDEAQAKVAFSRDANTTRFNDMVIHFGVHIDNADDVRVFVDPNSAVASREWVEQLLENYTFETITKPEIEEITGETIDFDVVDVESLTSDDIARLLDDNPDNDPKFTDTAGALSNEELFEMLEEE